MPATRLLFVLMLWGLAPLEADAAEITGTTTRVSLADDGSLPNDDSVLSAVSDDGRYVAFCSNGTNLTADDEDWIADVFVRDTLLGTTELISLQPDGLPFASEAFLISMSGDARSVYFMVRRGSDEVFRVWVRDRTEGTTRSLARAVSDADVSADGHWLAYTTSEGELQKLWLRDTATREDQLVVKFEEPYGFEPSVADTGAIAFSTSRRLRPADADGYPDVYLWRRSVDRFRVLPQDAQGTHPLPARAAALASNGGAAAFRVGGGATAIWMLWDRVSDSSTYIDDAPFHEFVPLTADITPDGRYVTYVKGEEDEHGSTSIHLYAAHTQTIERIDVNDYGFSVDDRWTAFPAISPDGRFVTFTANKPSLAPGTTRDYFFWVFLRDREGEPTPGPLPNLMIRTPDQPFWSGEGDIAMKYDGSWLSLTPGSTEEVKLRVRNESPFAGEVGLEGPGSSRRFKLRYFANGVDVTQAVTSGSFARTLQPDASVTLVLSVHARHDVPDSERLLVIRAWSLAVPGWRDVMTLLVDSYGAG